MNKTLYILDAESLEEKFIEHIESKKDTYVLALNFNLENQLRQKKINLVLEKNLLKKYDYGKIDQKAYELSLEWCRNKKLSNIIKIHEINLGESLQYEIFHNLLKYVHRITIIQKAIDFVKPTKILSTFGNELIDKIAIEISNENNFQTEILEKLSVKKSKDRFDKVNFALNILNINLEITVTRKQFTFLKKMYESYSNIIFYFSRLLHKNNDGKKSVLFLDFNLKWHESLFKEYQKNNFKIFCLNNRRPIIWDTDDTKKARELGINKVEFQNHDSNVGEISEKMLKNLRDCFEEPSFEEIFKINDYNFWRIFKLELLHTIENRITELISLILKTEKYLNSKKINLVWTLDDWGLNKTIVEICKNKKIPVCLFLAGSLAVQKPEGKIWSLPFAKQRTADMMLVWGENDLKNCIDSGADERKIIIGGAPRYDKYFLNNSIKEEYILVLTGGFPSTQYSYFNSSEPILKFEKLFTDVLHEIKKLDKKIILKRHPTQGPQEFINFQNIVKEIVPNATILKNANTLELISNASLIISGPSTVLEEAIILNKPIIFLPYHDNDEGRPYVSTNAVINIKNSNDFNKTIHDVLFDEDIKKILKNGRKKFLEKTISYQGSASRRHFEISMQLIDKK